MSFQPIVPIGGLPGWVVLNNTLERQTEVFNKSPRITRDTEYFEQTISKVTTAEELVSDRRLLSVALGAFGLDDDINNRALIKRVLEEGSGTGAIASRLSDDRYGKLADAFGFGDARLPRTQLAGFGREIVEKFKAIQFEVAVGAQNESLRLAMNAQREFPEIASKEGSEDAKWFAIMGNPPLRKVFEVALGLPESFAQLDLDRQLEIFKKSTARQLNITSLSELSDPGRSEDLIRRYLLRDQIASIDIQSSNSIALTLLQM